VRQHPLTLMLQGAISMHIYSKHNPPIGFYVYSYHRNDGTPYYIGKGVGKRAWRHHKSDSIHPPTNSARINIIAHRLEESESFLLEKILISKLGRKDLGTGILRNRTSGGEGSSGRIATESQRNKMRGDNNPSKRPENRQKIIDNHHTKKPGYECHTVGENNHRFGKKDSEETRQKKRKSHLGKSRLDLGKVCVSPKGEMFNSTREAANAYGVVPSAIRGLIYRKISGWKYA
jgi:hypothetical protein